MSYIALANITLSSSASSVTFSNIPNTYKDLVVIFGGTLSANAGVAVVFNWDTNTSNYSRVFMYGESAGAGSGSTSNDNRFMEVGTGQGNFVLQIMDYSATDKHKTTLARANQADRIVWANAGRWANTAAISSIQLDPNSTTTFASGATLALYGIAG